MDTKELAHQVLVKRKAKRLSQTELADMTGISRNYVSLIERGEAINISMKIINQLADALGTSSAELTGASVMVMIPPSLRQFAVTNNLPYAVIDKLANIPRRGREPQTPDEWAKLYELIKPFIDMEES